MHKFTSEDLLQFLYNETSPSKTIEIKAALHNDWILREKLEVITSAHKRLEALQVAPRQQTMNSIFAYAEKAVGELSPLA